MKRSISVERLYPLGDYKNIKFIDTVEEIDETLALNPEFVSKLFAQLMISCDLNYLKYKAAQESYRAYSQEELIEMLSETYDKLTDELVTIDKKEE